MFVNLLGKFGRRGPFTEVTAPTSLACHTKEYPQISMDFALEVPIAVQSWSWMCRLPCGNLFGVTCRGLTPNWTISSEWHRYLRTFRH